ncbi:MAG: hypothetical protein DRO98_07090 [Archaeoglobales archaeon]|nr:MAG: hypothetical protein DRO98_07090 [Archaeoglobales archaeon]
MITYVRLAEMFGIPPAISEKVANALADVEENFGEAIRIEEFDEIMDEVGEFLAEIAKDAEDFNAVCMAINLYAFCLALERRMREVGFEEVKASLSDVFRLRDLISGVKLPQAPIYHHPLVRTVWQDMEPLITLKISEIVREMAEDIWREQF